jgi:VanZ family protein
MTLKSFGVSFFKRVALSFAFSVVYGIIIEVLQEVLTDTRRFEWADIVANATGAVVSLLLISALRNKVNFLK